MLVINVYLWNILFKSTLDFDDNLDLDRIFFLYFKLHKTIVDNNSHKQRRLHGIQNDPTK